MRIYMDNSATSFPKPIQVVDKMRDFMLYVGTNVSRSSSDEASTANDLLFNLREKINQLFDGPGSKNVIFTKNITEALNIVIHGLIQPGDKVMISSVEHNGVTRPLTARGATLVPIPVSVQGIMDLSFVKEHIHQVKALVCNHVSNVSGDIMPIEELAQLAHEAGVPFIVDAAQSAGVLPISMTRTPISCLCFTGHKALMGPTGTGGMVIDNQLAEQIPPLLAGGTGSMSDDEHHPLLLPDKFEAGTPNVVGLAGLLAGIEYIESVGMVNLFGMETQLGQKFYSMLSSLPGIRILGSQDYSSKLPVFSIDFEDMDNGEVSYILATQYRIDNRVGLHCAPRAHQSYNSYPHGAVRLSLSHFTTEAELQYAFDAIASIISK